MRAPSSRWGSCGPIVALYAYAHLPQRFKPQRRNFQGYSTQPDCDLIGLGVSAIGRVGATYRQNAKTLPEYYDALRQGQLPVVRGLARNSDDLVRRSVIMALMCQGRVDFESIELSHLIDMRRYFARELERLAPLSSSVICSRTTMLDT